MMMAPARTSWTTILCDSLEKVFPDTAPRPMDETMPLVAYRGQRVSFQVAVLPPTMPDPAAVPRVELDVTAASDVGVVVHAVGAGPQRLAGSGKCRCWLHAHPSRTLP